MCFTRSLALLPFQDGRFAAVRSHARRRPVGSALSAVSALPVWTVPRLMGEPFLDKPILYFWMQAASLTAFGPSEFAVRLPGTVMTLLGVAAIRWLGYAMFGPVVGTWAALCYATMLLPFAVSLVPLHDVVMVPLCTVAFGAFWHARQATSHSALARWTLVAGVALGLSISARD